MSVQQSTSSSSPRRLDERRRRRDFILERGLLNLKKQQALDRKRTREERELYNRGRVFARFTRYDFYLSGKVETSCNLPMSFQRGAKYELWCFLCVVLESSLKSGSSICWRRLLSNQWVITSPVYQLAYRPVMVVGYQQASNIVSASGVKLNFPDLSLSKDTLTCTKRVEKDAAHRVGDSPRD